MEGWDQTFRVKFSNEGVSRLRDVVREKLKEVMGDYTDDTLVEYVIVLLKNGRRKAEAKNELDVFLGDDSYHFVSWLWDHLGSNLSLYVETQEHHGDGEAEIKPIAELQDGLSDVEAKRNNSDKNRYQYQGQGDENLAKDFGDTKLPDAGNTFIDKETFKGEPQQNKDQAKTPLSPHPITQRKRRRTEEHRQRKVHVSPSSVGASRRLLQFAVRDAVATSRPSLKRLRSTVSKSTEDTPIQETPKQIGRISVSAALKAVEEAAEDVNRTRKSRNVFDRLGHGNDFPNTAGTQELGYAAGGIGGVDLSFGVQDLQSNNHLQKDEMSQRGSFAGILVGNSLNTQHSSAGGTVGILRGPHTEFIQPGAGANNFVRNSSTLRMNTNKSNYNEERDMSNLDNWKGMRGSDTLTTRPKMVSIKENSVPVVAFNGNVKPATTAEISGKAASQTSLHHIVHPEEDVDSRTIFVNNVHFAATKDSLSRHFNKFGEVLKVNILTDSTTGQPQGSAYIEFMRKDAADLALSLNGTSFMSRILRVLKKTSAQPEVASLGPRIARASPYPVPRIGIPRGIYRGRVHAKSSARRFQWKREPAGEASSNIPPTRSMRYIRTEQKTNGSSGNA